MNKFSRCAGCGHKGVYWYDWTGHASFMRGYRCRYCGAYVVEEYGESQETVKRRFNELFESADCTLDNSRV